MLIESVVHTLSQRFIDELPNLNILRQQTSHRIDDTDNQWFTIRWNTCPLIEVNGVDEVFIETTCYEYNDVKYGILAQMVTNRERYEPATNQKRYNLVDPCSINNLINDIRKHCAKFGFIDG